jgi:hypothetical protein
MKFLFISRHKDKTLFYQLTPLTNLLYSKKVSLTKINILFFSKMEKNFPYEDTVCYKSYYEKD